MSPQNDQHASAVEELNMVLTPALKGRARVRIQSPVAANDDSEPEPDVAVIAVGRPRGEHPRTALLVIEVADSTSRRDLTVKPPVRSGSFLPADEIAAKLKAIGVTPDKKVITHCQAGIRAAHGVFLLRLMGYPDARNYDASWSEWGNVEDTPITLD